MNYLTLGEAEKEVGVTKSTISRAIKDGRLSANRNEHGHFQIDPAELFRVYPPIDRSGTAETQDYDGRNITQQGVQHHATPVATPKSGVAGQVDEHQMVPWLLERLERAEEKLEQTEATLSEKEQALSELREAYNTLPSPEDFEAKLNRELERVEDEKRQAVNRVEEEKLKAIALQKKHQAEKTDKWKAALAHRKQQIESARREAEELSQQRENERQARELLSQKLADIESRGFFARLLNRKPKSIAG